MARPSPCPVALVPLLLVLATAALHPWQPVAAQEFEADPASRGKFAIIENDNELEAANRIVKMAEVGTLCGHHHYDLGPYKRILSFSILYDEYIQDIWLRFIGNNENELYTESSSSLTNHELSMKGANAGSNDIATIYLAQDEYIKGVYGYYGEYMGTVLLRSLAIQTNKNRTLGPVGKEVGTPFTFRAELGGQIVGIHGYYGDYPKAVNSIAVFVKGQ